MFVGDHWRGSAVRLWRGAAALVSDLPPTLTRGIVLAGSDNGDRLQDDRLQSIASITTWRETVNHTPPGAELARHLENRPDLVDRPAGPATVGPPVEHPALPLRANALVDSLRARQSLIAHLQARQAADLAELSTCYPGIHEFLATEIALALGIAEGTANRHLDEAVDLTTRLPATFAALENGRITSIKASTIRVHTQDLDLDQSAAVESDVLTDAGRLTVPELRHVVMRAVIRHDPHGADDRHQAAKERRRVTTKAQPDGMGSLCCTRPRRTSPRSRRV